MDRFEELTSDYLDGEIEAAGREELARILEADPARLRLFVDLIRESRILSTEISEFGEEDFARGVMADLEKDKTRFVRAVMSDVRSGGGDDSPTQRSRPTLPAKRRPGPSPGAGPAWMAWSAAAAAVLILLFLLLGGNDEAPRRDHRPKEQPIAEKEKAPSKMERHEEAPPPKPAPLPSTTAETPRPLPEEKAVPAPERTPKPEPETPKPEPSTPKPPPAEKRIEEKPTLVEVATLERADGGVVLERAGERRAARVGEALLAGDVLESPGYEGRATIKYGDGTTVAVDGDALARIEAADGGKRILFERGVLRAQVARQPPLQPMVIASPHGEAVVLGTTLRIIVGKDPKEGMRLDVEEGKVRLQRKLDGKAVVVLSGHYAIAAAGDPLTSRPARVTSGLVALYTFKEGRGAVVRDHSHAGAPLDLRIENESAARWSPKGLALAAPNLVASTAPASKIVKACKASNELTIELWIRPAVPAPANKDGRIFALSSDPMGQNFLLGQDELKGPMRSYFVRLRTTSTDLVGKPALASPDGAVALRATHVVYTRSASGATALYLDGTEAARSSVAGNLSTWNETYRLALGNELTNDRPWLGEFQLAALYSRALGADEVKQNLRAGTE